MGFTLQLVTFLSICWTIRGAAILPNQGGDKRLNNKHSNQNDPGGGDFYFDERKPNDENVIAGRAIHQSAWSKEDKEHQQSTENKFDAKFSNDQSLKNVLSYLLNLVQKLKTDVLSIKKMTSQKISKESNESHEEVEGSRIQNNLEENNKPTRGGSPKHAENEKENQQFKSNYITEYYQNNGIKLMRYEDDDLENSSQLINEESDDSSHLPEKGTNMREISKDNKNPKIKRKPDKYSFEAEKTTTIPATKAKLPEENVNESGDIEDNKNANDFKKSPRPSKSEQNNSKAPGKENEKAIEEPQSSETEICIKENNENPNSSLSEKNEPTKKPSRFADLATTKSPQREISDKAKSEKVNQGKSADNFQKGTSPSPDYKSSKNNDGMDFENKSGVLIQSTTVSSQSSKDITNPENGENQPDVSGSSSGKSAYTKQQEQTDSPKPEDQKTPQNKEKSPQNKNSATVSSQSHHGKATSKSSTSEVNTQTGTEVNDNPKEYKNNESNVISTLTPLTFNNDESNLNKVGSQDNSHNLNSLSHGKSSPTVETSRNTLNKIISNKSPVDNVNDKQETKQNAEREKSVTRKQNKTYPENQNENKTEQPKDASNISPTSSRNTMNMDNLNKASVDNLNDKNDKEISASDEPEKSSTSKQNKISPENQGDDKIEQPKDISNISPTGDGNTINIENSDKTSDINLNYKTGTNENNEPVKSGPSKLGKNALENRGDSKTDQLNDFVNISPTFSGNTIRTDNLSDKPQTTEGDISVKLDTSKQEKTRSGNQEDIKTEQPKEQRLINDFEQEISLKNETLSNLNPENDNKEEDDSLSLVSIDGLQPLQASKRENQNQNDKVSNNPQEYQKNDENIIEWDSKKEISLDHRYEYEEDGEDFDISNDVLELNQTGDENFISNNRKNYNNDYTFPDNTATVFTNLSPPFQRAEYITEKPRETYDTILEYLYKHSNSPLIKSLKNKSDQVNQE